MRAGLGALGSLAYNAAPATSTRKARPISIAAPPAAAHDREELL